MHRKTRILHVVGRMDRGGVETWLMHILRNIDRDRYRMDFLVHSDQSGTYDDEIRSLGSRLFFCNNPNRLILYAVSVYRMLQREHFHIVHSHVHHFSGFVLEIARRADVPVRIAHSHTAPNSTSTSIVRRSYLSYSKRLINKNATWGLACSEKAAQCLYGESWHEDPRFKVLLYGIDLQPFRQVVDRNATRRALGIPSDALVVGHVGNFVVVKNHNLIIEVACEVMRHEPRAYVLLVGDGPLRKDIERAVRESGFADRFVLVGSRNDVPELMLGAMDIFLFPSQYEGLGLALVEAQAAGLPCVVSDRIPLEADVVPRLVERMPLSSSLATWAEALLKAKNKERASSEALSAVEQSDFNIRTSVARLERIYADGCWSSRDDRK